MSPRRCIAVLLVVVAAGGCYAFRALWAPAGRTSSSSVRFEVSVRAASTNVTKQVRIKVGEHTIPLSVSFGPSRPGEITIQLSNAKPIKDIAIAEQIANAYQMTRIRSGPGVVPVAGVGKTRQPDE